MAYYNYYNPYNNMNGMYQPNQSYSQNVKSMEWVDGKVGAQAFQMPQGWPSETPIVLWDNSEKKIYLKSWNQMGAPNPIQELEYTIKERANPVLLPANISGEMKGEASKEDIEELKKEFAEIKEQIANLSRGLQNRGASK